MSVAVLGRGGWSLKPFAAGAVRRWKRRHLDLGRRYPVLVSNQTGLRAAPRKAPRNGEFPRPVRDFDAVRPAPRGQPRLMTVPSRSSATACCSSACVFITIGPYQAPAPRSACRRPAEIECLLAGLHRHLVAAGRTAPANGCRSVPESGSRGRRRPSRSGRRTVAMRRQTCRFLRTHRQRRADRSPPAGFAQAGRIQTSR